MTIHIGRLTSEVNAVGGDDVSGGADEEVTAWEQERRLAAAAIRDHARRLRTATGYGDD